MTKQSIITRITRIRERLPRFARNDVKKRGSRTEKGVCGGGNPSVPAGHLPFQERLKRVRCLSKPPLLRGGGTECRKGSGDFIGKNPPPLCKIRMIGYIFFFPVKIKFHVHHIGLEFHLDIKDFYFYSCTRFIFYDYPWIRIRGFLLCFL